MRIIAGLFGLLALAMLALPISAQAAKVEDFELPRVGEGAAFKLSDQKGRIVALHFLLKTECPFCLRHVQDYHKRAPEVPGVVHVFIKPDTEAEIAEWAKKAPPAIPVYRDADAALADKLGVPNGYAFHKQTVHFPALILIDGEGNEVFRYVGKNNQDRVPFDKFAAEVAKIRPDAAVKEYNLPEDKVALQGYDPVAYFSGTPAQGTKELHASYRGVTYQFASAANLKAFAADPEKYLPEYGGWCATAMANGEKVDIDPANYKITNGRLFLFYKGLLGNAIKDWDKDEAAKTSAADAAWKKLANE